jgi:hypothetical protein
MGADSECKAGESWNGQMLSEAILDGLNETVIRQMALATPVAEHSATLDKISAMQGRLSSSRRDRRQVLCD